MNEKRLSDPELESEIEKGLIDLNIRFSKDHINLLISYIREIEKWNRRINLVKAAGKTLLVKHLFDSLAGFFAFQNLGSIVLDIGAGAGFPGIPLSLFMTDSTFILCERSGKKAGFLKNVALIPGLNNLVVFEDDFKNLDKKVDIITFRAFAPINRVIKDLGKMLNPGGRVIAYKGRREKIDEELKEIDPSFFTIDVIKVNVPFLKEERHIVILQ